MVFRASVRVANSSHGNMRERFGPVLAPRGGGGYRGSGGGSGVPGQVKILANPGGVSPEPHRRARWKRANKTKQEEARPRRRRIVHESRWPWTFAQQGQVGFDRRYLRASPGVGRNSCERHLNTKYVKRR